MSQNVNSGPGFYVMSKTEGPLKLYSVNLWRYFSMSSPIHLHLL